MKVRPGLSSVSADIPLTPKDFQHKVKGRASLLLIAFYFIWKGFRINNKYLVLYCTQQPLVPLSFYTLIWTVPLHYIILSWCYYPLVIHLNSFTTFLLQTKLQLTHIFNIGSVLLVDSYFYVTYPPTIFPAIFLTELLCESPLSSSYCV